MFRMLLLLTFPKEKSGGDRPEGEKVRNYDYETLCW